jgi:hypothetical protein
MEKEQTMKIEESEYEFKPRKGPYLIILYQPQNGTEQHEALINLFFRLKKEGLDKIVFHEHPDITLLEFMNFFSGQKCLLQIFGLMDDQNNLIDICGMAWLADIISCSGIMTKATGSFLFFNDYQKPAYTESFGEMILEYWFEGLKIDTLVGLTPALNRLSSIFIKRQGMKELFRIPQYTTFDGKICEGIVSWLSKEEYRESKRRL